ncbi:M24 family metallopeptidase [Acuticoccus kandeliae]|uniref:M24 family metallopeptidase n=1 Tax=Acuticoccus kandeliae TaxID=2073160 RepID=UPI0013001E37|nr:Xaa-Pro peptidase family protein [Acuticoccus kandeliae]
MQIPESGPFGASAAEYVRRRAAALALLAAQDCDILVAFAPATIFYLTAYRVPESERPFALILDRDGRTTLFVPLLKAEDARTAGTDEVVHYAEYPGDTHPIVLLGRLLGAAGTHILADAPTHQNQHGMSCPALADVCPRPVRVARDAVEDLRKVKSAEEIALIAHAARWAMAAQDSLTLSARAGCTESAVAGEATGRVVRALREAADGRTVTRPLTVSASFGGQIGPRGTADHVVEALDPMIGPGDMLITRATAMIGGYYADVERTMVAGAASAAVRDLFARGLEVQDAALAMVGPGVAVAEIEAKVLQLYARLGLTGAWRHHTGHSVGVLTRERPFIDLGDPTVLEPGMVVTVEPGIYRPGVGGFRHSDCLVVTTTGADNLTPSPRDLASLTVG